ncbi:hypothetical protein GYMLUDRAFT_102661, partial [Collybiopsis luxurians FD-317 M1]
LIGTLQKVNTGNHIGGEMESTIVRAHVRSTNLRRYLNRQDSPPLIQTLKKLFNKSFSSTSKQLAVDHHVQTPSIESYECAHYTYNNVNYSRSQTHLGNSLVLFYSSVIESKAVAGSIEKIEIYRGQPFFHIRRQEPLPPSRYDPFRRYPWFFAEAYSSKMSNSPLERIPAFWIVSHAARFNFSNERAVIVNLSR